MPRKGAVAAVVAAGSCGASLSFASAWRTPGRAGARGSPLVAKSSPGAAGDASSLKSGSCALAGVALAAALQGARRRGHVALKAAEKPAFKAGERVTLLGPPALAGNKGTVQGPAGQGAFAVLFDSGSTFNIAKENLSTGDAAPPAPPAPAPAAPAAAPAAPAATPAVPAGDSPAVMPFSWAPASYFAQDQLMSKGPRSDADVGSPVGFTRPLFKGKQSSVGAWACTEGGFPVKNRPTTEVFHILEGEGTLTDAIDGEKHFWRAGDLVVLPKGWSGRWDITKAIRKIWVVNNHPDDLDQADSAKCIVAHEEDFHWSKLRPLGARKADWGTPEHFNRTTWKVGSTYVGSWACTAGGFLGTSNRPTTEFFYVLEGIAFLTGLDGVARRVTAGDTVVLPKGWSGRWDIIEPIRKVFGVIAE